MSRDLRAMLRILLWFAFLILASPPAAALVRAAIRAACLVLED